MLPKKIIVTGACGYIGSHTVVDLIENGYKVISIDNFTNSYETVLPAISKITGKSIINYAIDICNKKELEKVFQEHQDAIGVIHFAAYKYVNESVDEPLKYYENNLVGLFNILACVKQYEIKNFVFSSSCSVYGNATKLPVDEKTALAPTESPYAETKIMAERIIKDFAKVNTIKVALLRYFNPAGAHLSGLIGEKSKNIPQNVIPRITGTALGKFQEFKVFGNDYNTRDGSCIRDYIHVSDIANGHTLAVKWLNQQDSNSLVEIFNMGSGNGVSVLELITAFEKATHIKLSYNIEPKRQGDVEAIFANNNKAEKMLQWKPQHTLEEMMRSAFEWDKNNK